MVSQLIVYDALLGIRGELDCVVANLLFATMCVRTSRSTRSVGPDANTPERPNTQKSIKDDDVIDI